MIERKFKNLAAEYRSKGNQLLDVSKNILFEYEAYRNRREKTIPAPERMNLRNIVDQILENENERSLQNAFQELHRFVYIDKSMLKLNPMPSTTKKFELDRGVESYLAALQQSIDRIHNTPVEQFVKSLPSTRERMILEKKDSQMYSREILSDELKLIAMKIESMKRGAVEEANRKGNHHSKMHWTEWEELATNALQGWPRDGSHSAHATNSQPIFCYKCSLIYQDTLKAIEPLKQEYMRLEHKMDATYV